MSSPSTLVLNHYMQPHRIVPWSEAVCLVYSDKASVLEEYAEVVSSPSTTMNIPAVLLLRRGAAPFKKGVKFSRVNVFSRDDFRCQYCGSKKVMRELNYDHVIPRRAGGKTTWENIVTSCYPCNDKKAGRTPHEAGMRLMRTPVKPERLAMNHPLLNHPIAQIPSEWEPYLDPSGVLASHG